MHTTKCRRCRKKVPRKYMTWLGFCHECIDKVRLSTKKPRSWTPGWFPNERNLTPV